MSEVHSQEQISSFDPAIYFCPLWGTQGANTAHVLSLQEFQLLHFMPTREVSQFFPDMMLSLQKIK